MMRIAHIRFVLFSAAALAIFSASTHFAHAYFQGTYYSESYYYSQGYYYGQGAYYGQGYYYSQGSYAAGSQCALSGSSSKTIRAGDPVTLSWQCSNSTSSTGTNFSTGGATSGSATVTPSQSTTYTIACSNGAQNSVTVNVLQGQLSITGTPTRVQAGNTATISWSASGVNSCSISGPGVSSTALSGSAVTTPLNTPANYTLSCQDSLGTISKTFTVQIIPGFQEL